MYFRLKKETKVSLTKQYKFNKKKSMKKVDYG
nr:MAG TPA: hypothetical protein [Crassvirales sp.]